MSPIKAAVLATAILLSPGLVHAQAQAEGPPADLLRAVEQRASRTTFAQLEAFGEAAYRRRDREGLNRLYHVVWIFQNQGEFERAAFWNQRLEAKARAQRDQRYIQIARLNELTARYDRGDLTVDAEMTRMTREGVDWFVRAHAARLTALTLMDQDRVGEGLKLLNQAEADIPDEDLYADTAHAGLWEVTGMGLMKLNDVVGATIAFRRFEIDYANPAYPRPDFDSLYNLTKMAVQVGDLTRAQAYYAAHRRLSLRTGLENLLVYDASLCAQVADAKDEPLEVLACIAPYGEDLGTAAFLMLDILPVRAVARARTGDVDGARRDLEKLRALDIEGGVDSHVALVEAELLFAADRPAEAYQVLRTYQRDRDVQTAQRFSAGIRQVTGDIQEQLDRRRQQLDMARANTELQRTVIRWQNWIVGIGVVFMLSALLTLIWQWRQGGELRSARRRAEDANRAKSEFLANMSHEIRTPLNGVVAMADALAQRDLNGDEHAMVEVIRSSGATLERLLSDILDSARIESGQVTIEAAPFHLGRAVQDVAALWRIPAEEKGVSVTAHVDPRLDRVVDGDAVRVRQVLTNLVSNALKFTAHGEVTLTVEPGVEGDVRFIVTDTGVGFDDEQKARIFGRFQQADGSITRRFGGTGLGLAISRELVDLMGGRLECDSTPGQGSRFWFEIPLPPVEGAGEATLTPEPVGDVRQQALRVLLADDHPANRKIIEVMLAATAMELVAVEDGAQALETFKHEAFDLVLMDMQMPVMDGLTATAEIRAFEAQAGRDRTPILMLTANAMAEHVEAGRAAGADGHLTKPLTLVALFDAMARAMASKERSQVA
ncbi:MULTISPECIES: hybrid sensor histidine kinase/response regulator [unclassified Brevundimonas]|uniref:hybrid sensor histidine kinase/response regulator n=1 Tax=unclassified Brevundimonas TaxID=2622653 RepID=UPI0025C17D22|nr:MULTISPECIES: ATP-binding protein [unclassified Brevundimonas]